MFGGLPILAAALLIGFDVTIRQIFVKTIGGAEGAAGMIPITFSVLFAVPSQVPDQGSHSEFITVPN